MKNKQIIDDIDVSECKNALQGKHTILCAGSEDRALCDANKNCLYKKYKRKEKECEKLNKQLILFMNGDYCTNGCSLKQQFNQLKEENEELRRRIIEIFACLIKANRDEIIDTLWIDDITTLWDYIALTLGIEGDQTQIEEQILQKVKETNHDF